MTSWVRRPLAVGIVAAAVYRVTRLLTTDPFPPAVAARSAVEDAVAERWPDYAHGVTCPWCVGFWVSALATLAAEAADRRGHLDRVVLAALPWALSTVTGLLADREVH